MVFMYYFAEAIKVLENKLRRKPTEVEIEDYIENRLKKQ